MCVHKGAWVLVCRLMCELLFFVWKLHGSTRFVVRAVALLSAKRSEKESSKMIIGSNKLCMLWKQHKNQKETRDKPRKGEKTASQRVSEATAKGKPASTI